MAEVKHTGWRVTSMDTSAYQTDANGDAVYGARVHFQTGADNTGSVFVRDTDLTPVNVSDAIDQKAAVLDQVRTLASGPVG